MFKRSVAVFVLSMCPLISWSAAATNQLEQFIREVKSATGEFSQTKLTSAGQAEGVAQGGTFSFERPGKFKWNVLKPYEQLTLSDGKRLYQYDPDLAQVIVRGVDESVGTSPAAILFGSGKLDESFSVMSRPDNDGMSWLRAEPRSPDAGFAHVDIGFKGNMPMRLLLLDSFGQTSRIDLNNIVTNPVLAADEFTFTAPDGVDVVNM